MGEQTNISWADATFNPWIGCTEVSVGEQGACQNCYARELAKRYGFAEWGNHPRHRTSVANWRKPLTWNRKAVKDGTQPFVFCSSLADVFDNQVSPAWRADLFSLIAVTPHLTWLLLTKRPQNIVKLSKEARSRNIGPVAAKHHGYLPRNAAIGCTVVTQREADRDIPHLLLAQAALRPAFTFLSMEPLMEGVDIAWALSKNRIEVGSGVQRRAHFDPGLEKRMRVDWVITGGETDQGKFKARPTPPGAEAYLRDQCAAAGVPFHRKQAGEWVEAGHPALTDATENLPVCHVDRRLMVKVGKKRAGRALDGVIHDARPVVRAAP